MVLGSKINQKRFVARSVYVFIEIVLAIGLFSAVAVSLVKALHQTSATANTIQQEIVIQQILQSAMIDALSNPQIEEGRTTVPITELTGDEESFFTAEIETIIEPLELENEEGAPLNEMYLVKVVFHWQEYDEWLEQSTETWRYGQLYQAN